MTIAFEPVEQFVTEALFAAHDRVTETQTGDGPFLVERTPAREKI